MTGHGESQIMPWNRVEDGNIISRNGLQDHVRGRFRIPLQR